jgi:hypothetical protein
MRPLAGTKLMRVSGVAVLAAAPIDPGAGEHDHGLVRRRAALGDVDPREHPLAAIRRGEAHLLDDPFLGRRVAQLDLGVKRERVVVELLRVPREHRVAHRGLAEVIGEGARDGP